MIRWFGVISVLIMLFSLMACAGKQPVTANQVANEVNLINKDLPKRIGSNTILESVTFDNFEAELPGSFIVHAQREDLCAWHTGGFPVLPGRAW